MDQIKREFDLDIDLVESNSITINGLDLSVLTGLYLRHTFLKKAEEFLKTVDEEEYCLLAIDMEHFRLFNKIYSREQGDILLKKVAELLKEYRLKYGGVIGYFGGDNFVILTHMNLQHFKELHQAIAAEVSYWSNTVGFLPAFGIYVITDKSIDVATMYDRATMALSKINGNYVKRYCIYSEDMEEKEEEELRLLSEIQEALGRDEFTFYVQPQCDISNGKIVGGECLVRWIHPEKGLISPGIFIPVLEKNGFIASLDRHIWRKVCKWLRDLLDRGFRPVPVSINVSRIDIYSMDVPEYLLGLLKEFDLPCDLLKVEITESTYAENNDKIIRTVKQLRDANLWVMMDDFGSGYSSLNMLKSIAVDVLKMDMRFLEISDQEEEKGISILESVINMARQMQVPIIVEGVETQKQESFLLKMGCRYSQGYYYYRPMPISDFEKIISNHQNLDKEGIFCNRVESIRVNEFWDKNIFSDSLLNDILGPVAFYDVYENNIGIIRVNNQYYELLGIEEKDLSKEKDQFWLHVNDEDKVKLVHLFEEAEQNQNGGSSGYLHFVRVDGEIRLIRIAIHYMREHDGHRYFYGSLTDVTELLEQKKETISAEREIEELTERQWDHLEHYYGEFPCGCVIIKVLLNRDVKVEDFQIIYANQEISRITGCNVDRMHFMASKAFVHRKEEIYDKLYRSAYLGERVEFPIYSSYSHRYLRMVFVHYQYGYVCCMLEDENRKHVCEAAMNGLVAEYEAVYYIHLQEDFGRMLYPDRNQIMERGSYTDTLRVHFENELIYPEDIPKVKEVLNLKNVLKEFETKDEVQVEYRRKTKEGTWKWCHTRIRVCDRVDGKPMSGVMFLKEIDSPA